MHNPTMLAGDQHDAHESLVKLLNSIVTTVSVPPLQLHNTSRFKISMNFEIFCIDFLFIDNLRTRGGHHNEL